MRRVTSDAIERLLRSRIDHFFPHRVIVSLFHVIMAIHAEFHDVRRTQKSFVIGRVRLVAVTAILERHFVLKLAGEFVCVMAGQTCFHAILGLQRLTIADMRAVAACAAILAGDRSVYHRSHHFLLEICVTAQAELFGWHGQLTLARRLVALVAVPTHKWRVGFRKQERLGPFGGDVRFVAVLAVNVRHVKPMVSGG